MAIDGKYGRVTLEHGDIGEDEPVIVFRARDVSLPKLLAYYHLICAKIDSPRHHLDLIMNSRDRILIWQQQHPDQVRVPTSENSRNWMD